MREIKFRAWDRVRRTWVYFYVLNGQQPVPLFDGSFLWSELEPWQQFTGLKDKNGKEIYEGDILRLKRGKGSATTHQVVFRRARFEISLCALGGNRSDDLFVLGNILENPELLK